VSWLQISPDVGIQNCSSELTFELFPPQGLPTSTANSHVAWCHWHVSVFRASMYVRSSVGPLLKRLRPLTSSSTLAPNLGGRKCALSTTVSRSTYKANPVPSTSSGRTWAKAVAGQRWVDTGDELQALSRLGFKNASRASSELWTICEVAMGDARSTRTLRDQLIKKPRENRGCQSCRDLWLTSQVGES